MPTCGVTVFQAEETARPGPELRKRWEYSSIRKKDHEAAVSGCRGSGRRWPQEQ